MDNTVFSGEDLGIYEGLSTHEANDGIGILVEMAKSGKIDPWNIDIVDVTEKYLQKMTEMNSLNLKVASRTFLFAAILCRMQSNVLAGLTLEEFQDNEELRCFYVAMTRAKTSLFIMCPVSFCKFGEYIKGVKTHYLEGCEKYYEERKKIC